MEDFFNQFHYGKKEKDSGESGGGYASGFPKFRKPKHATAWIVTILLVILAAAVLVSGYHFLMEYWQIKEIGPNFTGVFWTNLIAKAATQTVGFILLFVLLLVNILLIKNLAVNRLLELSFLKKKWPYVVLSFALALAGSNVLGNDLYMKLLLAVNGGEFGVVDPLFSQDIGYYVFSRPFLMTAVSGLKSALMLQIVIMAVTYLLLFLTHGSKNLKDIVTNHRGAFIHTVVNVLVYFGLSILSYKFMAENVMFSSFGKENDIFGAGYIESSLWMRFYQIAPFLILAVILLVVFFLYRKKYIATVVSIAAIPAAYVLVSVAALVMETLVVSPNERNLQSPYISYNMEATRQAYALDDVTEKEFTIRNDLTAQDIAENQNQIDNIRITDFQATLTAYNQLQYLKRYYTFTDVDIAPYTINGNLQAVFLAAREMNKDNMEESARSYANQVFRYTHGFGVVASPINRVTAEGQPEFYIKDIPPQSTGGMPEVKQPRIYYGEMTNDYVIVGPDNKELDYSEGTTDYENSFDGDTGVTLSPLKRLMFSLYYRDYKMLVSGNINSDSRILINRNILKRVDIVAPFFKYDTDPYIVVDDNGNLKWVIDGYTSSRYYPYAQPYADFNYIRNSIKVVVDAYTGDMKFYVIDENDPIAAAYRKIYPSLFADEPIDSALASHIRVPEYMFKVQSQIYQRYHIADAGQFYDKADVWRVATEKYENEEITMAPYFNIMQVEEGGEDELVLVLPFVLGDKYNMVGLLAMRTNQEHYGELVLYRFPKGETVYGPMQIENKIDNDPDISREMTLWGQGGSSVIRGNLLVIPFKQSLLYIEPVYITSKNNASLPEVKRVVAAYKDSIAMEGSIQDALSAVLLEAQGDPAEGGQTQAEPSGSPGQGGESVTPQEIKDVEEAVRQALDSYERFKSASSANDWTAMGESLAELDKKMQDLQNSSGQ